MTKLFKMYGELFMEVTPQPWLLKASKTVKTRIADGKAFCVNLNTGALTVYDPLNIREEAVEEQKPKVTPHFRVVMSDGSLFPLSPSFKIATDQLNSLDDIYGLKQCVVSSDQEVTPVGNPVGRDHKVFMQLVANLYALSHSRAK
jgi:hypothetical protein